MATKSEIKNAIGYINEIAKSLPNLPKVTGEGLSMKPVVSYTRKLTTFIIRDMTEAEIARLSTKLGKDVTKLEYLMAPVGYEMINHTKRLKQAFNKSGEPGVIEYVNWVHKVFPIHMKALKSDKNYEDVER